MSNKIYNEQGFRFEIDKTTTDYIHEPRPQWGNSTLKPLDSKYVVLKVINQDEQHVQSILFDSSTQTPITELDVGESCWSKLDFIRLSESL